MILTKKQKAVIRMHQRQGLPQREIAQQLRISQGEVSKLLNRGRARIQTLIKSQGIGNAEEILDLALK